MASKLNQQEHIVMLPFMAQGHLIPFHTLATHIHRRTGFKITIATTPLNIKYLQSTLSDGDTTNNHLHFAELSLPTSAGAGPQTDAENTENLPPKKIGELILSTANLEGPACRLLSDITEKDGRPPLCLISDFFFGWATNVASSLGTVNVVLSSSAYASAALLSLWFNLPHLHCTDDGYFTLPGFPEGRPFHLSQLPPHLRHADGADPWSEFFPLQLSLCAKAFGWLLNTTEEVEGTGLEVLRNYFKVSAWCIGPLTPARSCSKLRAGKELGLPVDKCLEWLDSQSSNSVIYVSFGSQSTISEMQMMELASGLEGSGRPFIWVIRPPAGHDLKGEFRAEWLPLGFEDRVSRKKQGLLVHNWAPQLEILSHESTGAFLSHCGWNSVTDSLSQGVPIIGWPLQSDQPYISKMLVEEMGVSVELARGLYSNIVAGDVKRAIGLVMDETGNGADMRKRAREIQEQMRAAIRDDPDGENKGSSVKAMDDFFTSLLDNNRQGSMQ